MKKTLFALMAGLILTSAVYADEPAILNDPVGTWETFKTVVNKAEPSGDVLWDVVHGNEFKAGSSIRLYSAENLDIPVVNDLDVRFGWFKPQGLYGTLSIALDRATGKEILKYAHVGWAFGMDGDRDRGQFISGPTVGVKATF